MQINKNRLSDIFDNKVDDEYKSIAVKRWDLQKHHRYEQILLTSEYETIPTPDKIKVPFIG